MKDLAVIIPLYNEEELIKSTIDSCLKELNCLGICYDLFVLNDGSTDNSEKVLKTIAEKSSNLFIMNKPNSGHGPTILKGYKLAAKNYEWIFQIDSDNEMSIEDFHKLWNKRNEYDFLIGKRTNREQSFLRKLMSIASRLCVRLFYGKGPSDVNSPYRLMKSEKFVELFHKIPQNTFAPNVIISGYVGMKKLNLYETNVIHLSREHGTSSIKISNFISVAIKSFLQIISFRFYI